MLSKNWGNNYSCVLVFGLTAGVLTFLVGAPCSAQKKTTSPTSLALNGLYRAFPSVSQFGATVGDSYVFSATGDVYKGWIGTRPVKDFDFVSAKSKEPNNTGKYVLSGNTIIFVWSNKTKETAAFRYSSDAKTGKITMSIGSSFCYKVVTWDKAINGTFDPSTYQGGFADERQGRPKLVDSITFSRDGRFTMSESVPALQGRYKVSGSTLTLVTPDKSGSTYSLHVFADHSEPPKAILIDGRPFYVRTK